MTFRQKIIFFLVVAATVPVLLAGWLSIRSSQREMVARIDDFNLRVATLSAAQISEFLGNAGRALELSVQLVPFSEFEKDALTHALKIPYRQFDFINVAALLDDSGVPVAEPAYEEHPGALEGLEKHEPISGQEIRQFLSLASRPDGRPFGEAVFGAAYTSAISGIPRVSASAAVDSGGGGPQWTLTAEISLREIQQRLDAIRPSARGTAFLVDASGLTVCHSDASLAAARASLMGLKVVAEGIRRKVPFTTRYHAKDGAEMAGAFAPISPTGWGLVVAQPIDEAFASVQKMRNTTILWVLIGLSVAVIGGLFLSIGIAAPIKAMVDGAERIAKGRYGERISVKSPGELGQLADSFNRMSGALQESFDTIYQQKEEIAAWNEELQERVNDRTRELREAEEQIIRSEKMAAVAELSAGMAHEINNPLTSILGFAQLMMRQTESDHKFNRYLGSIADGAKRIRTIVDDMLRFSRRSGKSNYTDVDVTYLLENTLKLAARQLAERRIQVVTNLADTLPTVHGDGAELQQVFIHLVNNAKSAMPDGGTLKVGAASVEGGAVKVSVSDTGVGISEENRSKIFNPFFTTKEEWGRTGIGLSVSDRIVREHGGKLSVTSKKGQGAAFVVYLPGVPQSTHMG